MTPRTVAMASLLVAMLAMAARDAAAADDERDLVVVAGRPLHVTLDRRTTVRRVGQPITATVADAVFVYDRLVIPKGARVTGHVERFDPPPRRARAKALLGGDFSPHRRVVLAFDSLVLSDGRVLPIATTVRAAIVRPTRQVTPSSGSRGDGKTEAHGAIRTRIDETTAEAKARARETVAMIRQPGRLQRLKAAAIDLLPYHPQFLDAGTMYAAELVSPLDVGAPSEPLLPISGSAAPGSVLSARLVTPLDSSKTPRGTPVAAIVTEPVLSSDGQQLVVPEGTRLVGEVTYAKPARHLHRNGALRFLIERAEFPQTDAAAPLLASVYSVETSADDRVALDEEGGATVTNSKVRFIAPALAVLALSASTHHESDADFNDSTGAMETETHVGNPGLGAFFGFGLVGTALSQVARPVGLGFAVIGVGRTVYRNLLGKGREVIFQPDTPLQLQLAPAPVSDPAP
jgi:hypothetical protein